MTAALRNAQRTIFLQAEEIGALRAQLEYVRNECSQLRRIVQDQEIHLDLHRFSARHRLLSLAADYDGQNDE